MLLKVLDETPCCEAMSLSVVPDSSWAKSVFASTPSAFVSAVSR